MNRGAPCQIQDLGAPGHLAETSIRPLGPRGLELRREFLAGSTDFEDVSVNTANDDLDVGDGPPSLRE